MVQSGFCCQLMVNWWFGILGVPPSNNLFHKGIPGIQTTNLPLVDVGGLKRKKTYLLETTLTSLTSVQNNEKIRGFEVTSPSRLSGGSHSPFGQNLKAQLSWLSSLFPPFSHNYLSLQQAQNRSVMFLGYFWDKIAGQKRKGALSKLLSKSLYKEWIRLSRDPKKASWNHQVVIYVTRKAW